MDILLDFNKVHRFSKPMVSHLYAVVPTEEDTPDKFLIKRALKNEPIENRLTILLREKLPNFF